ncbi:MAG: hypothetical protein IPH37_19500 [Burkholderiales bacterium]|nr:hypothetical protein [Burkholderiales bacterium]
MTSVPVASEAPDAPAPSTSTLTMAPSDARASIHGGAGRYRHGLHHQHHTGGGQQQRTAATAEAPAAADPTTDAMGMAESALRAEASPWPGDGGYVHWHRNWLLRTPDKRKQLLKL